MGLVTYNRKETHNNY